MNNLVPWYIRILDIQEPLLLTTYLCKTIKIKKKILINWTKEYNVEELILKKEYSVEEDKTAGRRRNALMDNLIAPYV